MRYFFFFQAEDGIRDRNVTGVQTCALPICHSFAVAEQLLHGADVVPLLQQMGRERVTEGMASNGLRDARPNHRLTDEIGRASCRLSVKCLLVANGVTSVVS